MSEARIYLDAQVLIRRDIEANWVAVDPVLRDGEIAYSRDINRIKVGDGAHKWSELEYMLSVDAPDYEDIDLSGYAKKEEVTTLAKLLASMWVLDEDGNLVTDKQVVIKNNLIVHGDSSSGGEGTITPGGGGIVGIKVNGTTFYDTNADGIIDLGTISGGGGLTSVSWADIKDRPTSLSEFENDADFITADALNNYQPLSTAINTGNIAAQSVAYAANAGAVGGVGLYNGTEGIATITSAGVMEVGQYIDFHKVGSTRDYSVRLNCSNDSGVSIHLPSAQGTLALSSQIPTMLSQLTDNVGYALASSLANYLPLTGGTINGALTVASTIQSSSVICGTTRLRVNATGSTTSFGFIDALLYGSTNNRSTVHIGSCYGGSSTLTNTAEYPSGVSMTAISMYRGRVGIGKRFSDSELSAAHDGNVALTVAGNQTINGNLVVYGDIASA